MEPMHPFPELCISQARTLRRKRDATNNYTGMAGTVSVKPRHTVTLTAALITHPLHFHCGS